MTFDRLAEDLGGDVIARLKTTLETIAGEEGLDDATRLRADTWRESRAIDPGDEGAAELLTKFGAIADGDTLPFSAEDAGAVVAALAASGGSGGDSLGTPETSPAASPAAPDASPASGKGDGPSAPPEAAGGPPTPQGGASASATPGLQGDRLRREQGVLPVVLEFRDPGPGESAVSITWTGSDGRPKSWVG
ncbi:MAG: hypothetical protein AAF532_17255, partial [Planctomycetota bacterium]